MPRSSASPAFRVRPMAAAARSSRIRAPARGGGLAAGIQVALDVLLPGERTVPYRQNSTQVNFVIRGAGHSVVGRQAIPGKPL